MLRGSWFLPQEYLHEAIDSKNRGEAKAENGVPGCSRPHDKKPGPPCGAGLFIVRESAAA